jgi:hypothetical protein
MKDRKLREDRTVSFEGFTYTEHLNNFRQFLEHDPYGGKPWMQALVVAGYMLMSQLAPLQQLQATRPDCAARLPALVRTPFLLGYIFGACAAAIEHFGIDRKDSRATSVILQVHQLVFEGDSIEDCVKLSDRAVGHTDFSRGMHAAGVDADAFEFGKVPPVRLSKWLDAQLNVEAPSEKTQDEGYNRIARILKIFEVAKGGVFAYRMGCFVEPGIDPNNPDSLKSGIILDLQKLFPDEDVSLLEAIADQEVGNEPPATKSIYPVLLLPKDIEGAFPAGYYVLLDQDENKAMICAAREGEAGRLYRTPMAVPIPLAALGSIFEFTDRFAA